MRLNPFSGQPNEPKESRGEDGHVVKPAGRRTIQMPGARLSHHCNEAEWDLQAMGERDMRQAEAARQAGMQRGRFADQPRPRGERP